MDYKKCNLCDKTIRKGNIQQGRDYFDASIFIQHSLFHNMYRADICKECIDKLLKYLKLEKE